MFDECLRHRGAPFAYVESGVHTAIGMLSVSW